MSQPQNGASRPRQRVLTATVALAGAAVLAASSGAVTSTASTGSTPSAVQARSATGPVADCWTGCGGGHGW